MKVDDVIRNSDDRAPTQKCLFNKCLALIYYDYHDGPAHRNIEKRLCFLFENILPLINATLIALIIRFMGTINKNQFIVDI